MSANAASDQSQAVVPSFLIGSELSLLCESGIRYEGVLFQVDLSACTIALKNVRSFGTEDRGQPGQQVPPSKELFEYLIFRGSELQELTVLQPSAGHDPAVVAAQAAGRGHMKSFDVLAPPSRTSFRYSTAANSAPGQQPAHQVGVPSFLIGSTINLISKNGVHYEGALCQVDLSENTLVLKDVRSFGTKDRRGPGQQAPPSSELFEYMMFKGSDVQELTVVQPSVQPDNPAVVTAQVQGNWM